MKTSRKLLLGVGPLVVAGIIALVIFLMPIPNKSLSDEQIERAATALNKNVYTGEQVLNQAFTQEKFVPFLGASELSRFDMFHPNVLAKKYDRNYTPFMVGLKGTTLLNQYAVLQSLDKAPKAGKIVVIVSLASFEDNKYQEVNFANSYSELQMMKWLSGIKKVTTEDRLYAQQLLKMSIGILSPMTKGALKNISQGQLPNQLMTLKATLHYNFNRNVEKIFGPDISISKGKNTMTIFQNGIKSNLKKLPTTYDHLSLQSLSVKYAEESTHGNPYAIYDPYFQKNVKPILKKYDGFYKNRYHGVSKGFGDLELVLSAIKEKNLDAYFILPTMHPEWMKHTKLPPKSIADLNTKLTQQLTSQGFANIIDMNQIKEKYTMQDPLHIGWRGWVEIDKELKPFLESPKKENLDYQLDPYYFSKEWQQYRPTK